MIVITQKIFFTSDLHFGHENVLRFDNRPFASTEEMDAEIIRRWNAKVGKGDIVYVLGDMIWKTRNDDAPSLIKQLNGQIILIKGNHDRFLHNSKAKAALAGIKDYDDICVTLQDGTKKRVILSHYFIPMYNGHFYGAIHLHGHSHFTQEADDEVRISRYLNEKGCRVQIYNVGCMYWNYEPVTLDEILAHGETVRPENRINRSNPIVNDVKILKASLLSVGDINNMPSRLLKYHGAWWTRSPGMHNTRVVTVGSKGEIDRIGADVTSDTHLVRPALAIDTEDSKLEIGDTFTFGGKCFEIVGSTMAFCLEDIGFCEFNQAYSDASNMYEKANIEEYVEKWFKDSVSNQEKI